MTSETDRYKNDVINIYKHCICCVSTSCITFIFISNVYFTWITALTSAHKTAPKRLTLSNISRTGYQWDRGMGREVTSWLRCLGGDLLCTWPDAQTATPDHVSEIFLSLLHVLVDLIQALIYAVQLFCPCEGDGEGELKGEICKHAHTQRVHISICTESYMAVFIYVVLKGRVNNKNEEHSLYSHILCIFCIISIKIIATCHTDATG